MTPTAECVGDVCFATLQNVFLINIYSLNIDNATPILFCFQLEFPDSWPMEEEDKDKS